MLVLVPTNGRRQSYLSFSPMSSPWSFSTTGYQLTGKTHEEICRLCTDSGLAGIEGVPPLFDGKSAKEISEVADLYRSHGLKIDSFHLPFAPENDIASFYTSIRQKAVDTMKEWMECAALAGARAVIQHPTTSRFNVEVEGLDRYLKALEPSLKELTAHAAELDLIVAIENMLPGPDGSRFGSSPAHFETLRKNFSHPNLGFCLDTGHALVSEHRNAGAFFDAMGSLLAAFHLADNAGDRDSHLAPGHGRVDWREVFSKMKQTGFTGIACIETPPFDYGPDFAAEAWREMVEETARLAATAVTGQ